ncbi:RIP metalloprotease RseP [Thiomicrorhabdus sp.]|uniref:RIP metalloprotease RseP n=1 Tax=Thiomicrorhabdus sp. TaxID=2039724 RepID=UPI0029C879CD|nr:RIP metalloprotease RseP [Thiomicrorhabdus sp.]
MTSVLWSLIGFVLMMGVIVTVHEWGHFQVARWFNIKVTRFSVGFGKAIFQRRIGETDYQIGAIPLGGYVKFADEREGDVAAEDLPRAFNRQSVYKRIAVVSAGPLINLILALGVFWLMFLSGPVEVRALINSVPPSSPLAAELEAQNQNLDSSPLWQITEADGESIQGWKSLHQALLKALIAQETALQITIQPYDPVTGLQAKSLFLNLPLASLSLDEEKQPWFGMLGLKPAAIAMPAVVGRVLADSPAGLAGLREGDRILAFNGTTVQHWQDFVAMVQAHPAEQVTLKIERAGVEQRYELMLNSVRGADGKAIGQAGVGVLVTEEAMQPYVQNLDYGVWGSLNEAWNYSRSMFEMSLKMLQRVIFGDISLSHLSGPLSIAQYSGEAIQSGWISFLSLLGLLSLSVGILNLLPIPVLDGGHLLYYLIEIVKGSPVSENAMQIGQMIGLFVIMSLTFVALFNDLIRISHG